METSSDIDSLISSTSVSRFEIHFDNERTIFIPGQKIEGYLAITAPLAVEISFARVRFYGKVLTHLQKFDHGIANENSTITMFKDYDNLIGEDGVTYTKLQAGDHVYPFHFRMPTTSLPASFEGTYGSIRYTVSATLKPRHKQRLVIHKHLGVPSTKNSNDEDLQNSVSLAVQGLVGLFTWNHGFYEAKASIPRHGYTSGYCYLNEEENAPISIRILNHSDHGISIKSILLKQKVSYTTIDRSRGPKTERIHKLMYSERFSSDTRDIERLIQFPIPQCSVMDPDIDTNILKVHHYIVIKIQSTATFSKEIKISLPIVIAGFPYLLFEEPFLRRSIDTLPLYQY